MVSQQNATLVELMAAIKRIENARSRKSSFRRLRTMHEMSDSSVSSHDSDHEEYAHYCSDTGSDNDSFFIEKKGNNPDGDIGAATNATATKLLKLQDMFVEKCDTGPPFQEKLAETVNRGITQNFDLKQGLEKGDIFMTRENCKYLTVPKLNEEMIFEDSVDSKYKATDSTLQKKQQLLTKGIIPLVQMMNLVITTNTGDEKMFDLAADSLQLLAFAHRDLSNIRRKLLKPAIHKKYHKLCAANSPISTLLFGDNLELQLKTINESKQIGTKISAPERKAAKRTPGYRYQPYPISGHRESKDKRRQRPFLEQRQSRREQPRGHGYHKHPRAPRNPA